MSSPLRPLLFIDTNVFLHFQPITQIDWAAVLRDHGIDDTDLRVMIARVTVRELDKHKTFPKNASIKDRAQKALTLLRDARRAEAAGEPERVRERYPIHVQLVDSRAAFDELRLNPQSADDELIAAILGHRDAARQLIVVARDVGLQLSAEAHGILTVELPERYALPSEEDPLRKENAQLKKELATLMAKEPKLTLGFQSTPEAALSPLLRVTLKPLPAEPAARWKAAMRRAEEDVPEVLEPEAPETRTRKSVFSLSRAVDVEALAAAQSIIPSDEYARYAKDRQDYLDAYERKLRTAWRVWCEMRRSFLVQLAVSNSGTTPAVNVEVQFQVPESLNAKVDEAFAPAPVVPDQPFIPRPPSPPPRPRSHLERIMALTAEPPMEVLNSLARFSPTMARSRGLKFHAEHCGRGTQEFDRLKHQDQARLEPMRWWFKADAVPRGFSITYRITADNLAVPVDGTLNVHVVIA